MSFLADEYAAKNAVYAFKVAALFLRFATKSKNHEAIDCAIETVFGASSPTRAGIFLSSAAYKQMQKIRKGLIKQSFRNSAGRKLP